MNQKQIRALYNDALNNAVSHQYDMSALIRAVALGKSCGFSEASTRAYINKYANNDTHNEIKALLFNATKLKN